MYRLEFSCPDEEGVNAVTVGPIRVTTQPQLSVAASTAPKGTRPLVVDQPDERQYVQEDQVAHTTVPALVLGLATPTGYPVARLDWMQAQVLLRPLDGGDDPQWSVVHRAERQDFNKAHAAEGRWWVSHLSLESMCSAAGVQLKAGVQFEKALRVVLLPDSGFVTSLTAEQHQWDGQLQGWCMVPVHRLARVHITTSNTEQVQRQLAEAGPKKRALETKKGELQSTLCAQEKALDVAKRGLHGATVEQEQAGEAAQRAGGYDVVQQCLRTCLRQLEDYATPLDVHGRCQPVPVPEEEEDHDRVMHVGSVQPLLHLKHAATLLANHGEEVLGLVWQLLRCEKSDVRTALMWLLGEGAFAMVLTHRGCNAEEDWFNLLPCSQVLYMDQLKAGVPEEVRLQGDEHPQGLLDLATLSQPALREVLSKPDAGLEEYGIVGFAANLCHLPQACHLPQGFEHVRGPLLRRLFGRTLVVDSRTHLEALVRHLEDRDGGLQPGTQLLSLDGTYIAHDQRRQYPGGCGWQLAGVPRQEQEECLDTALDGRIREAARLKSLLSKRAEADNKKAMAETEYEEAVALCAATKAEVANVDTKLKQMSAKIARFEQQLHV